MSWVSEKDVEEAEKNHQLQSIHSMVHLTISLTNWLNWIDRTNGIMIDWLSDWLTECPNTMNEWMDGWMDECDAKTITMITVASHTQRNHFICTVVIFAFSSIMKIKSLHSISLQLPRKKCVNAWTLSTQTSILHFVTLKQTEKLYILIW